MESETFLGAPALTVEARASQVLYSCEETIRADVGCDVCDALMSNWSPETSRSWGGASLLLGDCQYTQLTVVFHNKYQRTRLREICHSISG